MNKTIELQVRSTHTDLLEAVRAAGIDLSYNEPEALSSIRSTARAGKVGRSFVVLRPNRKPQSYETTDANGVIVEVWYELDCDIKLLNKFTAFGACMHDGPFYPTNTFCDGVIHIHADLPLRRDRDIIAKWQATGGTRVTLL